MLLLLLEAAAALALVEYVRRELPALGAGAADAAATARRATRHIRDDTCELTVIAAEAQHRLRPSSSLTLRSALIGFRYHRGSVDSNSSLRSVA